jgi:hypothetical protein
LKTDIKMLTLRSGTPGKFSEAVRSSTSATTPSAGAKTTPWIPGITLSGLRKKNATKAVRHKKTRLTQGYAHHHAITDGRKNAIMKGYASRAISS